MKQYRLNNIPSCYHHPSYAFDNDILAVQYAAYQMCCRRKYLSSHCQFPNVLQAQIFLVTLPIIKCAAGTSIFRHLANSQMCCRHNYSSSPCQLPNVLQAQVPFVTLPTPQWATCTSISRQLTNYHQAIWR